MSNSNWFAKKLGGETPPAPSAPASPPAPSYPTQPAAPSQYPVAPQQEPVDPANDPNAPTVTNLIQNAEMAERASKANKVEVERCPGCGSANYFSRKFGQGGVPLSMPPKGQCFDCGYPTIQYGSKLGEGGAIEATGGAR